METSYFIFKLRFTYKKLKGFSISLPLNLNFDCTYDLMVSDRHTASYLAKCGTTLCDPQIIVLNLDILCVHFMYVCKVHRNTGFTSSAAVVISH